MEIEHAIAPLRTRLAAARAAGRRIALVPTMGSLHEGHVRLVDVADEAAELVVVSVFVNPLQFGPNEDYDSYPRTLESDAARLAAFDGVIFAPPVSAMYPDGQGRCATRVRVSGLDDILCGAARPGHFDGVCTVVSKLLNIVQPDEAFFGEKDFQQLTIIRTMVRDLDMPVAITGVPIVRAPDGLALSSRNAYLTPDQRRAAPELNRQLRLIAEHVQAGAQHHEALCASAAAALVAAGFATPDYIEIRRRADLAPATPADEHLVILAAARLGGARLLDNLQLDRNPAR